MIMWGRTIYIIKNIIYINEKFVMTQQFALCRCAWVNSACHPESSELRMPPLPFRAVLAMAVAFHGEPGRAL